MQSVKVRPLKVALQTLGEVADGSGASIEVRVQKVAVQKAPAHVMGRFD